jgi:hypothetical protein
VFKAFYEIDMPDIEESAVIYQQLLKENIDIALRSASDDWFMDLEDVYDCSFKDIGIE